MKKVSTVAAGVFISAVMVSPLWCQEATGGSPLEGLYPNGDYLLEINGEKIPQAEFYLAERVPALAVLVPEKPSLVLLSPGTSAVQTFPSSQLTRKPDGTLDLPADSAADQGKLRILASWIVFEVDGVEWTLKPKPWLLGVQDIPTLLRSNPEYRWRSGAYTPDKAVIDELGNHSKNVKVRVYFGTWCAFCKRYVPLMMKVASALEGSPIAIEFYGLPRGWSRHPVAGPLKITAVPTGIVYIGEKEVGRITGDKWQTPEATLKEVLESSPTSS
jgi:thiol-disulfide isomerase/thioredoxin